MCFFLQLIILFIIFCSVWLTRPEILLREHQRNVQKTKCTITDSPDHYYVKSPCKENSSSQCRLKVNDLVEGNGTIVVIQCKPGMSLLTHDFAVCYDGEWYPKDHNYCIKLSSTCGLSPPTHQPESNDKNNNLKAPWQAELYVYDEVQEINSTICGGTLISPQIVLTGKPCVTEGSSGQKIDVKNLFIGLGRTSRFERNYEQVLRVQQITVGGRFAALAVSGLTELVNIAILKLESPAEISWNVMPACFDSSILAPKTGHSFLSGMIVGRTNEGIVWDNVDAEKIPLRIKVFEGSLVNQGSNFSPIFTTNLTSLRPVGSGFIVDIADRKYILGVHVANRRYNGISEFNKVYFNSIGKVIRQHLKESYRRT